MHGEYKTPGGKLVVVDLQVDGGCLRNVEVSGDFFLYPEEALEAITAALQGISVGLDEQAIAARVREAIPPGTEVLGTSAEGIAVAVRRALDTPAEEVRQS